jgi:hypothetical protein
MRLDWRMNKAEPNKHDFRWHALPLTFVRKSASEDNPNYIRFQHENDLNHFRGVIRKLSDWYPILRRRSLAVHTILTRTSSGCSPILL